MQFIKSVGSNIIKWLKNADTTTAYVYDYDESDESDESEDLPVRDDSNDIIDEEDTPAFTRSTLYDEQQDENFLNCSCRGEDEDCEDHHSTTRTYSLQTEEEEESEEEEDIEDLVETSVNSLQKIFTNKYLDGIISCLKYLGYYNVNTNKEKIGTQYKQLSEVIDFSTTMSNETLEELFQKYGVEPDIENINKKVSRAFQLSKYIGTDNWNGFIKDLTKDELDYLLVGF